MWYYRFGKFSLKNYLSVLFYNIVLLALSIFSVIYDVEIFMALKLLPAVFSFIWILSILLPSFEIFSFSKKNILTKKYPWSQKTNTIELPDEATIIISEMDVCPLNLNRTVFLYPDPQVLKGVIAATIVSDKRAEIIIDKLHYHRVERYTASSIIRLFEPDAYVYSFVCDQNLLKNFTDLIVCKIIIPEYLFPFVDTKELNATIVTKETGLNKGID